MVRTVSKIIKKVVSIADILAGFCFFSVMLLVLTNILMRNIFKQPIMGTVEIVGLLVSTGLGLALANCEIAGSNIAMDTLTEKLSLKVQKLLEIVIYAVSLVFWSIIVWRIFVFANTLFINGRVTSTASIPIYPFIFVLGFSMLCLCVVLLYKLIRNIRDLKAEIKKPVSGIKEESI